MFKIISFASISTIIFIVFLNRFKISTYEGNSKERQNKSSSKQNQKNNQRNRRK